MTSIAEPPTLESIRQRLEAIDQGHLLAFADELDDDGRRRLTERLAAIDLERVPHLATYALGQDSHDAVPAQLEPAPYYPANTSSPVREWNREQYRLAGEALIRAGKVAAFTVAGGQGSRLGFDGPKGCYPAGAVTGKSLFQMLAEQVQAAGAKYGVTIPWRLMTSPLNHEPTIAFFKDNNYFGLDPKQIGFFQQGVLPSFDDSTGDMLLAAKDEPATNPDGHGGSLKALYASGAVDELQSLGVEHLSYTQIDNPLVRMIDPVFIGLHAAAPDSSGEMSSKMIAKTDAAEKVGVFCKADGRVRVIEYSDLPDELANQRDEHGGLRYNAGSPAIHVISLEFVRRLNEAKGGFALPLHRAHKKVPHLNIETGELVDPDAPNAIKLETFVFDAIPMCEQSIVLETDRFEFAPIKNADGNDSPATSYALQTERAAQWLEAAGVRVPRKADGDADCVIELSPMTAIDPNGAAVARVPQVVASGDRIAL